jgi:hypothetical protein
MTPLVIRMTIVSEATPWTVTYERHSDYHNICIIEATRAIFKIFIFFVTYEWAQ